MAAATKARGSNPGLKGSALTGATKLQTSNPGSCVTASSPLPESHLWWAVSRSWCNLHLTPHINHIQPIFSAHFKTNTMVWRDKIWCERGEREREREAKAEGLAVGNIFDPIRHFIESLSSSRRRRKKKELLMECSHSLDPIAMSGRKAGDR